MYCLCSFARSFARQLVHRLIEEVVLAGPGAVVHADDVQQRRFAGARRAHDRDELAFLDVEVDAAQHVAAAGAVRVGLLDVAQPDERVGRHCRSGHAFRPHRLSVLSKKMPCNCCTFLRTSSGHFSESEPLDS